MHERILRLYGARKGATGPKAGQWVCYAELEASALRPLPRSGALHALPYDVLNDFEPMSPLVTQPYILFARQTMPANDLRELIDWLRANPDKASAAIYLAGIHLVTAHFRQETGTHFALVPYRGAAPAVQDLAASEIDLFFGAPAQLPLEDCAGFTIRGHPSNVSGTAPSKRICRRCSFIRELPAERNE